MKTLTKQEQIDKPWGAYDQKCKEIDRQGE